MVKLDLDHVYKMYDNADSYSVTDFNLHIKDREFIVFVGPSGCGKSTTLRMIAGLEDITKGTFKIDGRIVNDEAPKDRDIAMVFQNYALYPHMTVYDNMAFGLKLRKYDKADIDKRVHKAASILGLEEYLQRKPAALSGEVLKFVHASKPEVWRPSLIAVRPSRRSVHHAQLLVLKQPVAVVHQIMRPVSVEDILLVLKLRLPYEPVYQYQPYHIFLVLIRMPCCHRPSYVDTKHSFGKPLRYHGLLVLHR